jgi:ferritin-like metal-binding protein YciE
VIVPPAPQVDLSQVYNKLDSLSAQAERIFAAQEVEYQARNAQLDLLNAKVQQHIDETHSFISKVGSFFSDGKTITAIIAGVGSYLVAVKGK